LIISSKGTLLAFCEGRRNSASDTGDIDVLLRRSFRWWQDMGAVQKVADMGEDTIAIQPRWWRERRVRSCSC